MSKETSATLSYKDKLKEEWLKDTEEVYEIDKDLPFQFRHPSQIRGYGAVKEHPLYRTSANVYGATRPTVHDMSRAYHGRGNEFTKINPGTEMALNYSLN